MISIAMLNVFQVGVGLLLLSVSAATSLAEERTRASLDVLLTTPLSTRSILAGKWAGAFRIVPMLLFAPVVTGLLLAGESGRWIQYFLFVLLLLAYSAVIVSIGLALATWQSRLGRALASCVASYIALSIGWPALVLVLTLGGPGNDRVILPLVMGTPLYGSLFATLGLSGPHNMPGNRRGYLDWREPLDCNPRRLGGPPLRSNSRNLRPLPGTCYRSRCDYPH